MAEHGFELRRVAIVFVFADKAEGVFADRCVLVVEPGKQERVIELAAVVQRPECVQTGIRRRA